MRTGLSFILAAAIGGCVPQAGGEILAPAPAPVSEPAGVDGAASLISSIEALAGEYRVGGIDGKPLSGREGIAVSISDTQLSFEPACAGFVWRIAMVEGELRTFRPGDGNKDGEGGFVATPTGPVCRIAVPPEKRALAEAIDAARQAVRTPSNGIELSGGGHSVTLFSQ